MKQLKKVLTIVLGTVALTNTNTAIAQNMAELVKPSFKAGQKFQTDNVMKTVTKMEMMGQEMDMKTDVTIVRQFDIKEKKGNIYNVSSTITKMATTADMMGQNISYDSDKKEDTANEMAKALKDKINVATAMEMNEEGKINPLKKDKSKADTDASGVTAMLENLGAGADETMLTDDMFALTPKNIKAGDAWSDSIIADGLKTYRDYIVKSVLGNDAVITISGKQLMDKKVEANGMEMTVVMENRIAGEMSVDASIGLIKQRMLTIEGSGNIEMMGQQVPMATKVEAASSTKSL